MAFSEDIFPPEECCEICGIRLDDEVVIQEFADGSLARLCPECAAGAVFEPEPGSETEHALAQTDEGAHVASLFPDAVETDPMEMTKELLSPVSDLICLQTEMQAALERLAASLERFASGVILESVDKSLAVDSRIRNLENELERTRSRLREAESLLVATAAPAPAAESTPEAIDTPAFQPVFPVIPAPAQSLEHTPTESSVHFGADEAVAHDVESATAGATGEGEWAAEVEPSETDHSEPTAPAPTPEGIPAGHGEVFSLEEIRVAQRFFNESPFLQRIRDVRRSLGKPKANLSRIAGTEPRVIVTVFWDIVWYQYVVNLRKDAPADQRVALFREGMDLEELPAHFREKNGSIDDDGRLDASELEVRLLSDPTILITEMSSDDEQALEDATEEIWDQRISPEFKWDD